MKTVVKLSGSEHIDENKCSFLESVYLPGFMRFDHISGRKLFFNGNSGITLKDRLKKSITEYDLYLIMEQLVVATERLMHSNLSIQQLVLDPQHIHINETTKVLQFLYVPLEESVNSEDILAFMTSFLTQVKPVDKDDTDYITRFMFFLKSLRSYSPKKIERYIEYKDRTVVSTLRVYEDTDERTAQFSGYTERLADQDGATMPMEERGTVLLEHSGDRTVLLSDEASEQYGSRETMLMRYPVLERLSNRDMIQINKAIFRIGKDMNSVDYVISDNPAISGSHIDFIIRGDQCYAMDLNSKNGTSINGRTIPVRYEIELEDGDRIRLANEDFVFHK